MATPTLPSPSLMSKEQIAVERAEMMADPKHPLNVESDVRHPLAVARFMKLTERQVALGPAEERPPAPEAEKPLVELGPEAPWDVPQINSQVQTLERFGLGRSEIQDLLKGFAGAAQSIIAGRAEMPDPVATEATLKEEWKGDFDRKALAARLFAETLPAQTRRLLNASGLGDHLELIRAAARAGEKLLGLYDRKLAIEADPNFHSGRSGFDPIKNRELVAEWQKILKQLVEGPEKA